MNRINRTVVTQVICCLLIFLFVYTALSKFHEFSTFKNVLGRSPLIGKRNELFAWALPITELSIAALLLIRKTQRIGLLACTGLMLLFTCYVSYMILFVPHLPCSCGGVIRYMSWKQHLLFNITVTLLALSGALMNKIKLKSERKIAFT